MAKTLPWDWIWGFISICFLRLWTYVRKGQQQSKPRDILEWQCEEVTKLQGALKGEQVLNKKQCENLLNKLHQVVYTIHGMITSTNETYNFELVLEELCRIIQKIQLLVEDCGKQEWCHAAAFQMNNREAFRELVYDLKCFWDAICEIHSILCEDSQYVIPCIDFNVATYDEIQADEEDLERKLKFHTMYNGLEDYLLAKYLLRRVEYDLKRVEGVVLDNLEVPKDFMKPKFLKEIGFGAVGKVYKSNWLGVQSATKVMKGVSNFHKEASILAGLSHPNIIKFIGCGTNENHEESLWRILRRGYGEVFIEQYLVMEFMETSLGGFLEKQKTPLSYIVAIDIMYEIAKGMCYLHDMYVAHLDVKPDNVLVTSMTISGVEGNCGYHIVKVMDYGTSKMEVQSKPELQKHTIGTPKYMAPEMNRNKEGQPNLACPFQADVWSFAMTCSEILSLRQPFLDTKYRIDILQKIKDHVRPDLPINCQELTALIDECWVEDPSQRPTFSDICKRLTTLKKKFMIGTYSNNIPQFDKDCSTSQNVERNLKALEYVINIHASKKMDEPTTQDEVWIGLESKIENLKNHLKRMNILSLTGMGGIGKTTLAKAIFDKVKSTYNASCFIEQLKNKCSLEILREILQELGSLDKEAKPDLVDAHKLMRELLANKKIILILDDPLDEIQIHDILPIDAQCVNKGTNIIITTRDRGLIEEFVEEDGQIDVEKLNGNAAKELFNFYAFSGKEQLSPQFFDVRSKIVEACNGLPLSLKILGAFLREKERIRSWERTFERIKKGRCLDGDEGLWSTLRISFDVLKEEEKNLFLDIACFFSKGYEKETTLRACTSPIHVLDVLVNKSLVTIDSKGKLDMHDQLRDMGQNIAENDEMYMGTRIWKKHMIPSTNGLNNKIHKKVEAILLDEEISPSPFDIDKSIVHLKFNALHLLICRQLTTLPDGLENFTSLKSLNLSWCWSLTTLPEALGNLTSLTTLELSSCRSLTTLPEALGKLTSLTTCDLSQCSKLTTLPEALGNLTSLTTLNLSQCWNLTTLPEALGKLTSLTTCDLSQCSKLTTLPEALGNLTSLTTLNLSQCWNLTTLPETLGNMTSLTTFNLSQCRSLTILPEALGNLISLTTLHLHGCTSLTTLPYALGNLSSLTTLNSYDCGSLITLPEALGNLTSLTTLNLSQCKSLTTLPDALGNLSSLTTLNSYECGSLITLPEALGNLTSLTTLNLSGCRSLTTLPEALGNLTSLTTLDLHGCTSLTTLPDALGNLSSLTTLNLYECGSLITLPEALGNFTTLTTLDLSSCGSLTTLPEALENLTSLTTLNLYECGSLTTLPHALGNLTSLTTLNLSSCSSLTTLPEALGNLISLTTLNLSWCMSLTTLPEAFGNLTSLTTLNLYWGKSLKTLPEALGNLASLITLNLYECGRLTTLPEALGNLPSLTILNLSWCTSLRILPEALANLSLLTTLNLSSCNNLRTLPDALGNLTALTTVNLSWCTSLKTLPEALENLTYLTTLDLSSCRSMTTLPEALGKLTSLTTLDLSSCGSLTTLPEALGKLTSLTTLDLSSCGSLTTLPEALGNLTSLTTLDLSSCRSLTTLPEALGNLTSLRTLNLCSCGSLTTLPESLGNLSSLTTLDLSLCRSLTTLPEALEY